MLIALGQVCAPVTAPLGPDLLDVHELALQVSCQQLSECVMAEWVCLHAMLYWGVARRPWAALCWTAVALASWLVGSVCGHLLAPSVPTWVCCVPVTEMRYGAVSFALRFSLAVAHQYLCSGDKAFRTQPGTMLTVDSHLTR
jgi:hypothetical protein